MFVNKIGKDHIEIGKNNQDYGFELKNIFSKLVCDGCSEGHSTEVGAKLFSYVLEKYYEISNADVITTIKECFDYATACFDIVSMSHETIRDFLCFTVLHASKNESNFVVNYCGDGFIIKQDINGDISFEELSDGEYPKYYIYNKADKDKLKYYKDGVEFSTIEISTSEYINVGIASDGIRFVVNSDNEELKQEFCELLKLGNEVKMKRFINRNSSLFKDDVTISF